MLIMNFYQELTCPKKINFYTKTVDLFIIYKLQRIKIQLKTLIFT